VFLGQERRDSLGVVRHGPLAGEAEAIDFQKIVAPFQKKVVGYFEENTITLAEGVPSQQIYYIYNSRHHNNSCICFEAKL